MLIFKNILAFIICVPFWGGVIWLMSVAMEFLINLIDSIEEHGILYLIKGLVGFIVSIIVPSFGICLGLGVWLLAEQIFAIG